MLPKLSMNPPYGYRPRFGTERRMCFHCQSTETRINKKKKSKVIIGHVKCTFYLKELLVEMYSLALY